MRSIWNGAISFGLVSIPIKLVNATESHSVSFRQIHTEDGGRIRYRKVCELEEKEVAAGEIGKAYEDADGSMIPITDDDLAQLPIPTAKTIEIVAFVPADRIDPLQMGTAYYLAANGVPAAKPYTLLREALKRSRRVAIAKFALRGRERLGMLRVVDDVIAMHGLLWPDEIRAPESAAPETQVTVRDAELDLADTLMDTLGEVDLDSMHDDYREAVEELIASKVSGEPLALPAGGQGEGGGKVIDLMSALENSVRAAQASRTDGEDGSEEGGGEGEGAESGQGERNAEVTDLPARKSSAGAGRAKSPSRVRRSAPAAPKGEGGKKSTSTSASAKKTTASKTSKTSKKTASTSSRSTASKKTSSSGKASSGKASTGKGAAAKKTAAKKTPAAKKTTSGRRASA